MVKQLSFIPIILNGLGQAYHIHAADILHQLYRHRGGLSIEDLFIFFKNRNKVLIWEAVAGLQEMGLVKSITPQSLHDLKITDKGIEKMHMILACFNMRVQKHKTL